MLNEKYLHSFSVVDKHVQTFDAEIYDSSGYYTVECEKYKSASNISDVEAWLFFERMQDSFNCPCRIVAPLYYKYKWRIQFFTVVDEDVKTPDVKDYDMSE